MKKLIIALAFVGMLGIGSFTTVLTGLNAPQQLIDIADSGDGFSNLLAWSIDIELVPDCEGGSISVDSTDPGWETDDPLSWRWADGETTKTMTVNVHWPATGERASSTDTATRPTENCDEDDDCGDDCDDDDDVPVSYQICRSCDTNTLYGTLTIYSVSDDGVWTQVPGWGFSTGHVLDLWIAEGYTIPETIGVVDSNGLRVRYRYRPLERHLTAADSECQRIAEQGVTPDANGVCQNCAGNPA